MEEMEVWCGKIAGQLGGGGTMAPFSTRGGAIDDEENLVIC